MTISEAAYEILEEFGKPISSKEIAQIALNRQMVRSSAKDPIQSHAQTIEKIIRDDIYNNRKLIFVYSSQGRLIGLPGWESAQPAPVSKKTSDLVLLKVQIPVEIFEKIKLAEQAKIGNNFDNTVALILTKGFSVVASEIKKGLMKQLDLLNN